MKKIFTLLTIFFLCSTWSFAQNCTIGTVVDDECVFLTDGTLTIPATHNLTIEVQGWGAGGGSAGGTNDRAGGGGGGYFIATYSVTAGAIFPIVVGQGGGNAVGGNTVFDIDGTGDKIVGGGGNGVNSFGAGGVVIGGPNGGRGGNRGGDSGGGGGGSGTGRGIGQAGTGSGATAVGGAGGTAGAEGAAGGKGGDFDEAGTDGAFPGGGAGGKGQTTVAGTVKSGGNGQVIVTVTASVLPVELVRFNANDKDNRILLEWQTASEINNEGFVIERGHKIADELEWNQLDFVAGNGTTQESQAYFFTDQSPVEGTNYYRLKQIDYDGRYEYSSVVVVEYSGKDGNISVGIFPNPAKEQLTLINGKGKATIYNVLGQPVKHLTIDANQATIQLADLLNGQYYLEVVQADGTIVTEQFSKVN